MIARAPCRARGLLCAALLLFGAPPRARQEPEIVPFATPLAHTQDLSAAGVAFVTLRAERENYLVGETLELCLSFGFEREFLASSVVQLFQRTLDVPAQVFAPAFEDLEGLRFEEPLEPGAGVSFALGERILRAHRAPDESRDGRVFAVFELTRRARAERPGEITLAAPVLAFARATRFDDDFLRGRVPLDREEALVRGAPLRLTIVAPPEAERPAEYTGAVGRFRIEATATPQDLVLGQALELRLRIERIGAEASGALAPGMEPRLEGLSGFHVRGHLAESDAHGLTVRYELVPEAEGVFELPPVRFVHFDPTPPAGYRTLETAPIPLVVRAPAPRPGSATPPSAEPGGSSGPWAWLGGALAVVALGFGLAMRRKARKSP